MSGQSSCLQQQSILPTENQEGKHSPSLSVFSHVLIPCMYTRTCVYIVYAHCRHTFHIHVYVCIAVNVSGFVPFHKYVYTCVYSSQCVGFHSIPQPGAAEKDCSHALELDPDNIKALYRRGVARKVSYCIYNIHFYSLSVSVSISNLFRTSSLR